MPVCECVSVGGSVPCVTVLLFLSLRGGKISVEDFACFISKKTQKDH